MTNSARPPVLVTGGNGYLGSWLTARLLADDVPVRVTIRSADREPALREALDRAGVDHSGLEVVHAGLLADGGWAEAVDGVREVHHVATPMVMASDPDDVVPAARDGALRVLRAARTAGVERVVLTSSFAAVGYTAKPVRDYTEDDWTDPAAPGLPAYPLAKTVAERAAWAFVADGVPELVSLNPTFILGPALTDPRSSLAMVSSLLDGQMRVVPRQRFGLVDVRDVAEAHLLAMAHPEASGRRYLLLADGPTMTYGDVARAIGAEVEEAAGDEPPPLTIHNERAKVELGFRPRPVAETLADTVTSLRTVSA